MFSVPLESLNALERHDYILRKYVFNNSCENSRRHKRDIDVIKDNHKFLWDDSDIPETWELRLAKKYYEKLFKEYCIADLSRYKDNKIAMRWRTEQEVVSGKGQFQCGSRDCTDKDGLRTWEVNFGYLEHSEKKNALVKLRLCAVHSDRLNFTSRKREVKRQKQTEARKVKEAKQKKSKKYDGLSMEKSSKSKSENEENTEKYMDNDSTQSSSTRGRSTTDEEITKEQEDVWKKKTDLESEKNTRETDFERYLEDLLL